MTRYLVTGGAGFLGVNLARHLLARGRAVASLDRAPLDRPDLAGAVRELRGDVRDRGAVARAVEGADVVVHAAAALPLCAREDVLTTGVDGTRNVLDASLAAGAGRVVFVSSAAAYGAPGARPFREDDPLRPEGPYGEAKAAAERLCGEYRARGLRVTVLRPVTFVGPERLGVFSLLYDWAASGRGFPLPGGGANRFQLLDVEDLCEAIVRAAEEGGDRADGAFNVGAREFGTLAEGFQAVLDRAGFGKRVVPVPAAPSLAALRALGALGLSPVYRWAADAATRDSVASVERIERALGFAPRFSNRDALVRNYEWYLAHRARLAGAEGLSHRAPWRQGALALAKRLF